ncbi:MAG: signal peptidase I [Oscillospiraceae bacterium]|jgi:signal peptidase I|nr:signal peptidase I [Oscillospiraceae bacterium]
MDEEKGFSLDEILAQYSSKKPESNVLYEDEKGKEEAYIPSWIADFETSGNKHILKLPSVSRRDICDWLESLIVSVAAVIFIMVFIARINQVYGISMQPTLTEGDRLIVSPLYGMPKYGDIVVLEALHLPNSITGEMGEPIVKRVIALPGDEIFIDNESGEVFRNGIRLDELYIAEKIAPDKAGNQIYPLIVEEGRVFVMGDNRNHSTDSRVTAGAGVLYYVGCVDIGNIIGRAVFRIYPFNVFGTLGE